MKSFEFLSPTQIVFPDLDDTEAKLLAGVLSYIDPEVEQELKRLRSNQARGRYIMQYGLEAFTEHLSGLQRRRSVTLLKGPDKEGRYSTLSGFASRLWRMGYTSPHRDDIEDIDHPGTPYTISYKARPPRYYQEEGADALWHARHAAVSLPTGSGKSLVIEILTRRHGTKTVIMAPSRSIASQLYDQLLAAFGKKYVGLFGDGKKESDKLIVVGIAASLTKVELDDVHGKRLSQAKVFVTDESHLVPASTFGRVCLELMAKAEDRYFVSATQFRNDGTDILLEGITGPVVYQKSLEELVEEGFLARPRFLYWTTTSPTRYMSRDWHSMVDRHIYSNATLAKEIATLANKIRDTKGKDHPVLILIDEVRQFKFLYPHLRHECGFAHGPLNSENKGDVDPRFQKVDVDELVQKFNDGQLPILIGTSCITTGTDLRPTGTIIYLMSGASEIKFFQAVGRGTRKVPGKDAFNFIFVKVDIPDVDNYSNVFYRHWKEVFGYCKAFGVRALGLSQGDEARRPQ